MRGPVEMVYFGTFGPMKALCSEPDGPEGVQEKCLK
ncbi:unnamed protein product [Larinioides sclopetarius]|uniref:Uncharacterized protein n=1 Tax=Larinioides sclopetarius TaxID=280406 RepID=A0AAV1ZNM6_9ARAC